MASHTGQATEKPAAAKGGMHVETWIFIALTAFFVLAAIVYAILLALNTLFLFVGCVRWFREIGALPSRAESGTTGGE